MTALRQPVSTRSLRSYRLDEPPPDFGPSVVTVGVFDGLHRGHRRVVEHARRVADERGLQTVLLTFDPHPARVLGLPKDTAALSTLDHRAELAHAAGADAVCALRFTRELAALSPDAFARRVLVGTLDARAVVVGANFTFGAQAAGDVATLHRVGAQLGFTAHPVPLLAEVESRCSSSHARQCLRSGDLDGAAHALGRRHRVDGYRYGDRVELAAQTALPPPGRYRGAVDGMPAEIDVTAPDRLCVRAATTGEGPVTVCFHAREEDDR